MDYIEANAWLKGERSTINRFIQSECDTNDAELFTARTDAAMTEQAYWVAKANKEKLTQ